MEPATRCAAAGCPATTLTVQSKELLQTPKQYTFIRLVQPYNYKSILGFLASLLEAPILAPVTTEYGLSKVNEQ
ncbi:hypothetical protein SFRURICE_018680 [Spodoptera frugiperda]|uniref:SFRICE_034639 n=1 Tax=Spodoptera frugiperda TaxID=7108 RepID=A0A2H1VAP9_SPOFR|nr:hypothetical protein SFRURICE_018680 [Spodoptera frugiperda]